MPTSLAAGPLPSLRARLAEMALAVAIATVGCHPSEAPEAPPDDSEVAEVLPEPPSTAWADAVPEALRGPYVPDHAGLAVELDLSRHDPVTALAQCTSWLSGCLSDTQGDFARCVAVAPTCQTETPWEEGRCCPRACRQQFQAAVDGGATPHAAYLRTFALDTSCVPGLTDRSGGGS